MVATCVTNHSMQPEHISYCSYWDSSNQYMKIYNIVYWRFFRSVNLWYFSSHLPGTKQPAIVPLPITTTNTPTPWPPTEHSLHPQSASLVLEIVRFTPKTEARLALNLSRRRSNWPIPRVAEIKGAFKNYIILFGGVLDPPSLHISQNHLLADPSLPP